VENRARDGGGSPFCLHLGIAVSILFWLGLSIHGVGTWGLNLVVWAWDITNSCLDRLSDMPALDCGILYCCDQNGALDQSFPRKRLHFRGDLRRDFPGGSRARLGGVGIWRRAEQFRICQISAAAVWDVFAARLLPPFRILCTLGLIPDMATWRSPTS